MEQDVQQPVEEVNTSKWWIASLVGIILSAVAWVALLFDEKVSFWCAVAALIVSLCGLKGHKRLWRDISITSIIASGVLLLVYAIFWGAILFALKSL